MGNTNPYPPALEQDDDPTPVAPAFVCGACVRVAEMTAIAESSGRALHITTVHSLLEQTSTPWTAIVRHDGTICAKQGVTEEHALYLALKEIGVVE